MAFLFTLHHNGHLRICNLNHQTITFANNLYKLTLSYIVRWRRSEEVNITGSRRFVFFEVISPKPDQVVEDKDKCKDDLDHILHHEHVVEET